MTQEKNETIDNKQFNAAQCQRNIMIFQITGVDITVLIVPVIVLVWLKAGLSFDEMLLLQGLFVLPTLILEVPSGSIADYWSRKGCSSIFHLLFGIAMFLYAIGNNFLMFALSEIIAGIAVAFQTGSDTAIIYDSLLSLNEDFNKRFGKIVCKRMTIMFLGAAIGAFVGGFLATISVIQLPIIMASIGHFAFATIVFLGYAEPPRLKAKTPKAAIMKAVNSLKDHTELKAILIFSLTGLVFGRIGFWSIQHILVNDFLVNALIMGLVIAGFNICAATSSLLIRSQVNKLSNLWTFLVIIIIEGFYFFVLIYTPGIFGILIMSLIVQITRGIRTPLVQALLQQFIGSDERATFVSLLSLVGSSLYFILSVMFNILDFSREQTLILSLVGMISLALFFIGFLLKNYQKATETTIIAT